MNYNSLTKSQLIKEATDLGLTVDSKLSKAEIISLIESSQAQELQSAVDSADSTESTDSADPNDLFVGIIDPLVNLAIDNTDLIKEVRDFGEPFVDVAIDNTDDEGKPTKSLEEIIAERKAETDAMYERKAQAEAINAKLEDIVTKEGSTAPAETFQKVQQTEAEKAATAKRIADIIAARKDLKTPKNSIEDIIRDRKIKAGVATATLEEVLAERRKKIR